VFVVDVTDFGRCERSPEGGRDPLDDAALWDFGLIDRAGAGIAGRLLKSASTAVDADADEYLRLRN
jgi:hypothetical protein